MAFLPGWRQAYPGGRREHICHHPAPRLAVLGSGWGGRFTLWQPLSPLPWRVYLALFSLLKQQNNQRAGWKTRVGKRQRDKFALLLLGRVTPMPGHHPQPPGTATGCTIHQAFSSKLARLWYKAKITFFKKNTEREKLFSGFLEILRQKNKHSSWKRVVVLKSVCQEIAVQNKKEQKLFI